MDDIALFVVNIQALPDIISHIQYISTFTGLSLNLDNTIAYSHKMRGKHLFEGIQLGDSPVKYLGAYLGSEVLSKLNFEKPLHLMRVKIRAWSSHSLTLQARVLVAKTFIFSLFTHVLNTVNVTN